MEESFNSKESLVENIEKNEIKKIASSLYKHFDDIFEATFNYMLSSKGVRNTLGEEILAELKVKSPDVLARLENDDFIGVEAFDLHKSYRKWFYGQFIIRWSNYWTNKVKRGFLKTIDEDLDLKKYYKRWAIKKLNNIFKSSIKKVPSIVKHEVNRIKIKHFEMDSFKAKVWEGINESLEGVEKHLEKKIKRYETKS